MHQLTGTFTALKFPCNLVRRRMRGTALNGQVDILDCEKHLRFYKALVHSESIKVEIRNLPEEAAAVGGKHIISRPTKYSCQKDMATSGGWMGGQNLINSKSSSSSSTHLLVATFLAAVHR